MSVLLTASLLLSGCFTWKSGPETVATLKTSPGVYTNVVTRTGNVTAEIKSVGGGQSVSAATKTCAACGGSGKCWGCKGKGSYLAAANIASGSSSPVRAAMAARSVNCKACGGTGACPGCSGNSKK